jgi:inorganic triphosphatase YgiF
MNNSQMMQNPISRNALEMYQKGDKQGLNELANNLCKEKGINRQDFEKQIRSQFGM